MSRRSTPRLSSLERLDHEVAGVEFELPPPHGHSVDIPPTQRDRLTPLETCDGRHEDEGVVPVVMLDAAYPSAARFHSTHSADRRSSSGCEGSSVPVGGAAVLAAGGVAWVPVIDRRSGRPRGVPNQPARHVAVHGLSMTPRPGSAVCLSLRRSR